MSEFFACSVSPQQNNNLLDEESDKTNRRLNKWEHCGSASIIRIIKVASQGNKKSEDFFSKDHVLLLCMLHLMRC